MWNVEKAFALAVVRLLSGLSLCKLTFRKHAQGAGKEGGLMLHDLQLDFCKRQSDAMKTTSIWHTRLLNGYLAPVSSTSGGLLLAEQNDSLGHTLMAYASRAWWSVPDDGYVHPDLARHLVCANLGMELTALLLDARWTYARAEIGGILALKSDFKCLLALGGGILPHSVSRSFELIWKAIQLSWGRASEGRRSFQFYLCGRLVNLRMGDAIVDSYLKSVEMHTPMPYLVPVTTFFPDPRSAQEMEIPVESYRGAVCCSPCGRFIAAAAGSVVVVADASTGDVLKRLEGHSHYVSCVSFARGSKKIVSGSWDNSVAIWEWETLGSPAQVFEGHRETVTGVAVSSDAARIFSCSHDCTLRIWDANTGAQVGEFVHQCTVWSVALSNDDQSVAIGVGNGTVKVLNGSTGGTTIFEVANAHGGPVRTVAFSAKGQRLATGSWDRTIRLWDTASWTSIGEPFQGHTDRVRCVTFSPDGERIASGSRDGTVRLWDANTRRNIWTSSNVRDWVTSVAFMPDGEKIISGSWDGTIRIWDTRIEAEENELEYGHSASAHAVAISHDGLRVVSGSADRTVRFWDSRTGNQIVRPMEGHTGEVFCVSFSLDGRQVVSGSDDKTLVRWDSETCSQVGEPLEGHTYGVLCVSLSSDGLRIVSGSADRTVRVWDVESWIQIGDALEGHAGDVVAVAESCDGRHVVSKDNYDVVIIWNRNRQTIVWKSEQRRDTSQDDPSSKRESDTTYELTDEEAENVVRSCLQKAPHLWPNSFPAYAGEVYCRSNAVYANAHTEDTLLATFPAVVRSWTYNEARKVLVAALWSGAVAICNLKSQTHK